MGNRWVAFIFALVGLFIASCDKTPPQPVELSPFEEFLEGKSIETVDDLLLDPDFNRAFLAMTKKSPLSGEDEKQLDALLKQVIGSHSTPVGALELLIEPVVLNPDADKFIEALQQILESDSEESLIN